MTTILLSILVPVAILSAMIFIVVRRGFEMRQLTLDGVDAIGMIKAKLIHRSPKGHRRTHRLHYAYLDADGRAHENRSLVTYEFWSRHDEGGPIDIVFSRSHPHLSAPRHLVEQSRVALAKKNKQNP